MALTELEVEGAFLAYLGDRGWAVTVENDDFTDLIAKRGAELLIAEVKGHTKSAGTAVDIGYGQLLRRMTPERAHAEYALVVPETLVWHVERVHAETRNRCGINVYLVNDLGSVRKL